MDSSDFRRACYKTSFILPRSSCKKIENSQQLSNFVTNTSFPSISTNSKYCPLFDESKFINCNVLSKEANRDRPREDTFRSRNRFIIARNVLGRMIKEKQKDVNSISKIVSIVWKNCGRNLHDYFEYLSLLEGYWNDCLRGGTKRFGLAPKKDASNKLSYSKVCTSSYLKTSSKRKPIQENSTKTSRNSRFRIAIDLKVVKKKAKRKSKTPSLTDNFRIESCSVTTWFGILTEDMFLNDF